MRKKAAARPQQLLNVFRPQPYPDRPSRQMLQLGKPIGHTHEHRRADQLGGIEDFFEQMLVQKNLHALDHAGRGLAALLERGEGLASHMRRIFKDATEGDRTLYFVFGPAEEYVGTAMRHASDVDALESLRAILRQRRSQSSITDGQRYTRALEAAYRDVWRMLETGS